MARPEPVRSIQSEVIAEIRAERIGGHTVADLNLPEEFLRRVADRVIRETFENRHRVVLAEKPGEEPAPEVAGGVIEPVAGIRVVEQTTSAEARAYQASLREGRPELRGFRAALEPWESMPLPQDLLAEELSEEGRAAAEMVARILARDGLLVTLARVIEVLGLERYERPGRAEVEALARVGLPVDLLAGCGIAEGRLSAQETVSAVAAVLRRAGSVEKCKRELARIPCGPAQALAGFRAAADSGQETIRAVRVQVTSGSYWTGPGDGGCLDLLRQAAAALPEADMLASVERRHAAAFVAEAAKWREWGGRLTVMPRDLPVSQWAQDNGKWGWDAGGEAVLMVPRYACRGEVGGVLVPGETFLAEGLRAAGVRVVRSPLLWHGGNLILVQDDRTGERTLLAGEAEVWRNTAMGLSAPDAAHALSVEFGADRIIVLPAASFHIDFEVSVRATPAGLIALVVDAPAAARLILECGLGVLARNGLMDAEAAATAGGHVRSGRVREALSIVGPVIAGAARGPGRFSEEFAGLFSTAREDHGPSNLYRVLLAMDMLSALSAAPGEMPADPATRAHLESFAHQEADRRLLRRKLTDAGMRVALIPSLAELYRGVTALNGLHEPGRYLMPAYGGLLAPVDYAAQEAIRQALGPEVAIALLHCAETQRRSGGVRCATSVATVHR